MQETVPFWSRVGLLTASSLTVMAGAIIAPAVQQIAVLFEAQYPKEGELLAKLVLSLPALAIALFAPVSGFVVDAFGSRRLLMLGLILYAVCGTTGFYLHDAYVVLAGRLGLGIAVAMVMTTATTMISSYFHGPNRGRFLGYQATAMAFGGVIFLPLGGLSAQFAGPLAPYLIYLVSLPILILAYLHLPEPRPRNDPSLPPLPAAGDYPALIDWRAIALIWLIAFTGMVAFYLGPPQLPFLMKEKFGVGPLVASFAVGTITLFAAITSMLYGRISRHVRPALMLAGFFLLLGLGFAIVGFVPRVELVWLGLIVAGLGGGLFTPTLSNWLMRIAPPPMRGRLAGGLISAMFAGQFLSPILVQPLIATRGVNNTFQYIGLGLFVLGVGYFMGSIAVVRRRTKRTRKSRPDQYSHP